MKMKVIRQGDVYIILNTGKPEDVKPRQDRVLAVGEATGHNHVLTTGIVYGELNGMQWIVVPDQGAEVVHQTHAPVALPPGVHEVRIQREYTPDAIRTVRD